MSIDEKDLRRALEARSGRPSTEFRARLSEAFSGGRPESTRFRSLALVATIAIAAMLIGALVLARHNMPPRYTPGAASSPRLSTPSPTLTPTPSLPAPVAGVLTKPSGPIAYPTDVRLSAAAPTVLWAQVTGEAPYLYRSTDSGRTWQQRPIPPGVDGRISFLNDREGWLVSTSSPETQCNAESASVWHTTDAGATWQLLGSKGVADAQCKSSISFMDPTHGFLDAWDQNHAPVIYRTSDGGLSWAATQPLPDPPGWRTQPGGFTLRAGRVQAFGSELLVPASGYASGALVQYVFKSTDGGATWSYLATATNAGGSLAIVTATRWIQIILPGQTVETTNGGASWHPYASDYSQAAPVAPDVLFAGPDAGYATVRGGIQITKDGGLHWTYVNSPGA